MSRQLATVGRSKVSGRDDQRSRTPPKVTEEGQGDPKRFREGEEGDQPFDAKVSTEVSSAAASSSPATLGKPLHESTNGPFCPPPPGGAGLEKPAGNEDVMESIRSTMAGYETKFANLSKEAATGACNAALQQVTGRLSALEIGQAELQRGQEDLKNSLEAIGKQISDLARVRSEEQLHGTERFSAAPVEVVYRGEQDVTTPTFWRKPDPTILYINVLDRTQITRKAFSESISKLVFEAGLPDDAAKIIGDELDARFEMQFTGDARTATVACLQFEKSLHLGGGNHKTTAALAPNGQPIQYFINVDKNLAQVRKEILCKRLCEIVAGEILGGKVVKPRKATGSVLVDGRPLCTVIVVSEEQVRISWVQSMVISCKVNVPEVTEQFRTAAGMGQCS